MLTTAAIVWARRPFLAAAVLLVGAARAHAAPAPAAAATIAPAPAGDADGPVAPASAQVACLIRHGFVVEPFGNLENLRVLSHLEAGLPALVAERLSQHAPLRFVGGSQLLASEPAGQPPPRFIVRGRFEPLVNLRLRVVIEVVEAKSPHKVSGRGEASGSRNEAPARAVEAALAAFASVPGLDVSAGDEKVLAPFARDPYAFTLYARGVSTWLGLGGFRRSAETALALLGRSLVIDPRVPETRRYIGLIHLQEGRPGHARANWSYAEDVRPDYAMVVEGLARLDHAEGAPTAEARYRRLLQLDPDDIESRRIHGELLYELGRLDPAQAELEAVLARAPDDMRARRALTLVLSARQAGPELVRELETVVKMEPADVDARMDLAAAYLGENRFAEAVSAYEKVLELRPRSGAALKLAADVARRQGQLGKAVGYYQRLRRLSPQDPRPVFLLGATYHQAGNLRAAERMFEEGSAFPGMRPEAFSNLGAIALETGRVREARWFLNKAARWRPNSAGVRFNLALALRALDQHAEALNELREAQKHAPADADIRYLAGVLSLRLGLLREAEKDFRAAIEIDPRHEAALHNLKLLEGIGGDSVEGAAFINQTKVAPPGR